MHFYYNAHVLVAPNGKWNGANGEKKYGDTLRPNHSTKKGINMYNIFMYKKAMLHTGMKKNHTSLTNGSITETIQATV